MSEPEMISLTEAAGMLGIHRDTAYRLAKRGDFPVPVIRLGSALRVSRRQLEALINPPAAVKNTLVVDGKQVAAAVASQKES